LKAMPYPAPVHFFGGDPFFRLDQLEPLLACARVNQMSGEISTTAAWVEDGDQVRQVLLRLKGKVHALQICASRQLGDRYGTSRIELLVGEARRLGIVPSLICSTGPGSPLPREILAMQCVNSVMGYFAIVPERSLIEAAVPPDPTSSYLLKSPPRRRRCAEFFDFVIVPGGDVYPCVPGIGVHALRLGSLERESAFDILLRTMGDEQYWKLWTDGPYHLYEEAQTCGAAEFLYPGYVDSCHFHRHFLSDPRFAEVISERRTAQPAVSGELT
jgi:hypothetical protein